MFKNMCHYNNIMQEFFLRAKVYFVAIDLGPQNLIQIVARMYRFGGQLDLARRAWTREFFPPCFKIFLMEKPNKIHTKRYCKKDT